jgi:hypothetical protein
MKSFYRAGAENRVGIPGVLSYSVIEMVFPSERQKVMRLNFLEGDTVQNGDTVQINSGGSVKWHTWRSEPCRYSRRPLRLTEFFPIP